MLERSYLSPRIKGTRGELFPWRCMLKHEQDWYESVAYFYNGTGGELERSRLNEEMQIEFMYIPHSCACDIV